MSAADTSPDSPVPSDATYRSFSHPETEFSIISSESPVTVDGYAKGEPKYLACDACGARVLLTREPSQGIDEIGHGPDCPQRFVRSRWWVRQMLQD